MSRSVSVFVCDGVGLWTESRKMSRVGGRWLGIGTGSELECARTRGGVTMSVGDLRLIR